MEKLYALKQYLQRLAGSLEIPLLCGPFYWASIFSLQGPHFPGRIGTRVPILPEKWGPGMPILGGPYFHVTPVLQDSLTISRSERLLVPVANATFVRH